jgi:hypothetical protein
MVWKGCLVARMSDDDHTHHSILVRPIDVVFFCMRSRDIATSVFGKEGRGSNCGHFTLQTHLRFICGGSQSPPIIRGQVF